MKMKGREGRIKAGKEIHCSFYVHSGKAGAVAANSDGLVQVWLPAYSGRDDILRDVARLSLSRPCPSGLTDSAAAELARYFAGERVSFCLPVDNAAFTPFQQRVYAIVRGIPYGEVRTYGEIAREAGVPRAARGVGAAMAANPLPIVIPCHRVVGSFGALTGYSAPGGVDTKKWLLAMEGVMLDCEGRVILRN